MTEMLPKLTRDGSFTFFSPEFGELFHSHHGAKQEAELKFVQPCRLREKASQRDRLVLLDLCYGLGYNSAAALEAIWDANPNCCVELIALECNANIPKTARRFLEAWPPAVSQLLDRLATTQRWVTPRLNARLWIADARLTLRQLCDISFQADAIFLDPFSPPKCPQLWTVEFLTLAARCLKPTGILATYSSAAAVRNGLRLARLQLGSTHAVGRRSPGTVASRSPAGLPPLSRRERESLQTRAAVPYRDPHLQATAAEILRDRAREQQNSSLESSSAWKKRWQQRPSPR